MTNDQGFVFVEISQLAADRGTMDTRGLKDICDVMDGQEVTALQRPPYHHHCFCTTAIVIRPVENDE